MAGEARSSVAVPSASATRPFVTRAADAEPRWYTGALVTFLAMGEQTGGQFAVFEATARAGEAIPAHTHSREDEAFYILDGAMSGAVDGVPFQAGQGDFVFLPRGLAHTWQADAGPLRLLVFLTPAGFEQSFLEFSEPAPERTLPPAAPPDFALLERLMVRESELGVTYEPAPEDGSAAPP
ncbi:MAG: quercetin 2,3-dioxygenase [Chloroflexi bacterium]|nr:quercetin 2,3-dioxygenase [Chloroflexota bacterium]